MAYSAAAQKGSGILIQKGVSPSLTTIGGLRTKQFTINSDVVDVTTADDSSRYRQLLAATAIKHISVTGSGVIKDTAAQQTMATDALAQTLDDYLLTVPGIGTFAGKFILTQCQLAGEYNGEATWDMSLESGGDITFTAEG